jgi:hypothetical protein
MSEDNRDPVRALAELVALKQFAAEHTVKYSPREFDTPEAKAEYDRRKPLAWAAARAAISTPALPFVFHLDPSVPSDTIEFYQRGKLVGKIVGIGADPPKEPPPIKDPT